MLEVRTKPLIMNDNRLASRISSMPSELQPRCLIIQATGTLKRPQSTGVFGNGSERKVANSFSMGVVTKTVTLARHAQCSSDSRRAMYT